jgi:hypothetical protein
MKFFNQSSLFFNLFTISVISIAGCASNTPQTGGNETSIESSQSKLLGDMPLPPGSKIDNSNSLILGSGTAWTGRLSISSPINSIQTSVFFRDEFPKAGWTLVSSTTSKKSILVFLKNDRSVTIEIEDGFLGNSSNLLLTVAPKPSR